MRRFLFFCRRQEFWEEFAAYVRVLRQITERCDFGDWRHTLILDRAIAGTRDKHLQQALLGDDHATMEKAKAAARRFEAQRAINANFKQDQEQEKVTYVNSQSYLATFGLQLFTQFL